MFHACMSPYYIYAGLHTIILLTMGLYFLNCMILHLAHIHVCCPITPLFLAHVYCSIIPIIAVFLLFFRPSHYFPYMVLFWARLVSLGPYRDSSISLYFGFVRVSFANPSDFHGLFTPEFCRLFFGACCS